MYHWKSTFPIPIYHTTPFTGRTTNTISRKRCIIAMQYEKIKSSQHPVPVAAWEAEGKTAINIHGSCSYTIIATRHCTLLSHRKWARIGLPVILSRRYREAQDWQHAQQQGRLTTEGPRSRRVSRPCSLSCGFCGGIPQHPVADQSRAAVPRLSRLFVRPSRADCITWARGEVPRVFLHRLPGAGSGSRLFARNPFEITAPKEEKKLCFC